MNKKIQSSLFASLILVGSCFVYIACSDDDTAVKEPSPDAGPTPGVDSGGPGPGTGDGGGNGDGGGPKDCFDNPTTHFEIINACTTATKITKNPMLNKLLADGGLPPLI